MIKDTENQLEEAIKMKDIEEWRCFRSMRNQAFCFIKAAKHSYFIDNSLTQRTYGESSVFIKELMTVDPRQRLYMTIKKSHV